MKMFPWGLALLVVCLMSPAASMAAQPKIWGALQPGPYSVGYRSELHRDPTRSFFPEKDFKGRILPGDTRRPVPIRIWFPGRTGTGSAMKYADYVEVSAGKEGLEEFARLYASRNQATHKALAEKYASQRPKALDQVMASPVLARLGGEPRAGRFPIIGYAGGAYNPVDENVILLEYLASHGFVVAAVPAQHVKTVSGAPDAAGVEAETRDMEFALAVARQLPNADPSRVAAAGFSIGGATALLLAMRNSDVDAVIALDSSITSEQYSKGLTSSPNYDPAAARAPLLEMRAIYPEGTTHSLHVLDALRHSARHSFVVKDFDHADFNNYALAFETVAGGATKKGRSLSERRGLYEALGQKILQFLKGTLGGDQAAMRAVQSPLEARGAKLADVLYAEAASASPSPAELLQLIQTDGFPKTVAILRQTEERDPDAPVIAPATLNAIGHSLLSRGRAGDAVAVFRYNMMRNPRNLQLRASLAEALMAVDKACASKEYAAILEAAAGKGSAASQQERDLAAVADRRLKALPPASECADSGRARASTPRLQAFG